MEYLTELWMQIDRYFYEEVRACADTTMFRILCLKIAAVTGTLCFIIGIISASIKYIKRLERKKAATKQELELLDTECLKEKVLEFITIDNQQVLKYGKTVYPQITPYFLANLNGIKTESPNFEIDLIDKVRHKKQNLELYSKNGDIIHEVKRRPYNRDRKKFKVENLSK